MSSDTSLTRTIGHPSTVSAADASATGREKRSQNISDLRAKVLL